MTIDELRTLIKDIDGNLTVAIAYDENGSYQELFPFQGYIRGAYFIIGA